MNLVQGCFFFVLLSKRLTNKAKVINQTRVLGENVAPHCFSLYLTEVRPRLGGVGRPHKVRRLPSQRT